MDYKGLNLDGFEAIIFTCTFWQRNQTNIPTQYKINHLFRKRS
jgi:hypothetical protein